MYFPHNDIIRDLSVCRNFFRKVDFRYPLTFFLEKFFTWREKFFFLAENKIDVRYFEYNLLF